MAHGLLTLFTHRLLMSLLRETPILDGDLNPRRFIARMLPPYCDPSCIHQRVFVGRAQTELADARHPPYELRLNLHEHTNTKLRTGAFCKCGDDAR